MGPGGGWREVAAVVAVAEVDILSGALWAAGAAGIEEQTTEEDDVRLVVAVPSDRLDEVLDVFGDRTEAVREVAGDEGLDAWRPFARRTRVGPLTIAPAWEPVDMPATRELVVPIDPGHAFGSGAHATTRLALELLVAHLAGGEHVLDVGTGSGVLAIAAARLGAAIVAAVDNDDGARVATVENVRRNDVGDVVAVGAEIEGTFDVVVANITAPTLIELRDVVMRALRPGGWLILSGVLGEQTDAVTAAYGGIEWMERIDEADWVARAGRLVG